VSEARQYILPATLAALLHAAIVALFLLNFSLPKKPVTPLAIQATLIVEDAPTPPVRREPEPQPEPEQRPEPEPPPPEPDAAKIAREKAEEAKRMEDIRREQERVEREQRAAEEAARLKAEEEARLKAEAEAKRKAEEEAKRKAEAEAKRKAEEEAQRKAEEEKRLEEQRRQRELERQLEIERQRAENERKRREAEQAVLQAEIDAEAERLDAIAAGQQQAYIFAIQQKIQRSWVRPASARPGLDCKVSVTQLPGGEVVSVRITSCNGDEAVERSIEAAVKRASPLPDPPVPSLFDRNLRLTFKPEE